MSRKRWFIIAALILALVLVGALLRLLFKGEDVPVYQVKRENVVATLTVTGEVRADRAVSVLPKVTARILQLTVDEGDTVAPGQLLVELDPKTASTQVAEALARAAQARAAYEYVQQGTRPEQIRLWEERLTETATRIRQTQAQLHAAESRSGQAERNATRLKQLNQQGFASAQEAENAQTEAEVAQREVSRLQADLSATRAQQSQTQAQLSEAHHGPTLAERREAAAASRAAQAGVSHAQAQLSDYRIVATLPGLVTHRFQDPGDMASPSTPILQIINPSTLEIAASVEESDLAKIREKAPAFVVLDALPEKALPAYIREIGSEVNPENGTVLVKVALLPTAFSQLSNLHLLSGMTADVNIITARLKNAMVVPASAIRQENGQWMVYRLDARRFKPVSVQAERLSIENYLILSGLKPQDKIAMVLNPKLLTIKRVHPVGAPTVKAVTPVPPGGMR